MITLVQFIIAFSLSLLSDSKGVNGLIIVELQSQAHPSVRVLSDASKEKALQILENTCNVCHSKRNRKHVFTLKNMNLWTGDIYKQVFIKKRMPKGKNIKLTSQEYQASLKWISATQNI